MQDRLTAPWPGNNTKGVEILVDPQQTSANSPKDNIIMAAGRLFLLILLPFTMCRLSDEACCTEIGTIYAVTTTTTTTRTKTICPNPAATKPPNPAATKPQPKSKIPSTKTISKTKSKTISKTKSKTKTKSSPGQCATVTPDCSTFVKENHKTVCECTLSETFTKTIYRQPTATARSTHVSRTTNTIDASIPTDCPTDDYATKNSTVQKLPPKSKYFLLIDSINDGNVDQNGLSSKIMSI